MAEWVVRPIGYVRSGMSHKFDAPHQPGPDAEPSGWVELKDDPRLLAGLQDLDGFERIWLVTWFDRNSDWRPRVLPPRGPSRRRGVFATRSPHRPNPIGLTCTPLFSVDGRWLRVGPVDLTDGTPVLDIKPYLPYCDAHPDSRMGWIDAVQADEALPPTFAVTVTEQARRELAWLYAQYGIEILERARSILARDPRPHRTRRIMAIPPDRFRIACGPWRLYFRVEGSVVTVESVGAGYSEATLAKWADRPMQDRDAQIAFRAWQSARG
ncbi:MAG: tRNA (N6-threonylcarbamoyladenosine(37)-N6)-methyltransferase TrmO [Fimbriimonadaceae bacterium]|nr:tRNA (N6-threonylcarbamoyladenosine(37)-N6)-methyltransferase TrmO [Fimbriimonadaceae bacterium]